MQSSLCHFAEVPKRGLAKHWFRNQKIGWLHAPIRYLLIGMRTLPLFAAIQAMCFTALLHAETRTWTSSDGRKLDAELVSYDLNAETVTIKNNRGEFTLPFAKLVEEDQTFVRTLAENEAAQREVAAQ